MTKVMLVDDDASMQVLIEQIVRRGGYDFCCAGNGADGLEMLRACLLYTSPSPRDA